jgi:transcriptional regulator with XRE-family HTH domain
MKNIKEIRRYHFQRLLEGFSTQQQFAEVIGVAQGQISLVVSGHRQIGDRVARRIETNMGLPNGYLDHTEQTGTVDPEILLKQVLSSDQMILLKDYIRASPKHREMVREMASSYARMDSK